MIRAEARPTGYGDKGFLGKSLHARPDQPRPDGAGTIDRRRAQYDNDSEEPVQHGKDDLVWREDGTNPPVDYTHTNLSRRPGTSSAKKWTH
ncbi:MAG: hypothetical protein CL878_06395 [Dehalococcoidia bacterium]|nr:hypothetical protein [Dehalococcoidia bacterium]